MKSASAQQALSAALVTTLFACVTCFVVGTRHWTLIGDAVLMHYVVFLMQHGFAPYKDIVDVNMPGSYLLDMSAIRVFGDTAAGWRCFDLLELLSASAAILVIARPYSKTGGLLAASLFVLLHGSDGVAHAGERDFTVAVLLLIGCAFLLASFRRGKERDRSFGAFVSGICAGAAAAIKPHFLLAGLAIIFLTAIVCKRRCYSRAKPLIAGILGFLLPLGAVMLFLQREHALRAFCTPKRAAHGLSRLTGSALSSFSTGARRSPQAATTGACSSRDIRGGGVIWSRWEASVLAALAAVGLVSFIVQGKAYSYHRATLVAFVLCLTSVQLISGLRASGRSARLASLLVVGYAVFWLAPASTVKAIRWNCDEPSLAQLSQDLTPYARSAHQDGGIQCLDTTAGCITVLSRMHVVQSTGFLYDCYFFMPGANATREAQRQRFLSAINKTRPYVFVVTDQWCFNLPGGYQKLDQWPAFNSLLRREYRLVLERSPSAIPRRNLAAWPFGYRLYQRRDPE